MCFQCALTWGSFWLRYETRKQQLRGFDLCDVGHHIWKQFSSTPYSGTAIHSIYVDEVQDFTQQLLKLTMSVATDPNSMFLTGDTCQVWASPLRPGVDDWVSPCDVVACTRHTNLTADARKAPPKQRTDWNGDTADDRPRGGLPL